MTRHFINIDIGNRNISDSLKYQTFKKYQFTIFRNKRNTKCPKRGGLNVPKGMDNDTN